MRRKVHASKSGDSYTRRKSVIQNLPVSEVDVGGFAWGPLLGILADIGVPLIHKGVDWLAKKVTGRGEGAGLLRAGDVRKGSGLLQSGATGGSYAPGDINLKVPQHARRQSKHFKSGDIPLQTKYVLKGGYSAEKLKEKLIPLLQANNLDGFKTKLMKAVQKKTL